MLAGLLVPRLSGHAVAVLANLGTPASQRALVDVASRFFNPLAIRQAAGTAFGVNVKRFGLLLDREAIRQQYARYSGEPLAGPGHARSAGIDHRYDRVAGRAVGPGGGPEGRRRKSPLNRSSRASWRKDQAIKSSEDREKKFME